jgi:hypothetical protein
MFLVLKSQYKVKRYPVPHRSTKTALKVDFCEGNVYKLLLEHSTVTAGYHAYMQSKSSEGLYLNQRGRQVVRRYRRIITMFQYRLNYTYPFECFHCHSVSMGTIPQAQ